MSIRIVIAGAAGRMGQALIHAISEDKDMVVSGAFEAKDSPALGKEASPSVTITDDPLPLLANADALMDFTRPHVSVELAALAAQARIVHVLGTTGCSAEDDAKIRAAARHATIIKSGNMSLGINLLQALVKQAAKALPNFDVEIVEMHHRSKIDAPSGTALMLGRAAAEARGVSLEDHSARGRDGNMGPRMDGDIGFASLRGGSVIGDHQVILAGPEERITLGHIAEGRAIFAHGAIAAAKWGQGKKPGFYTMADVLGLSS
jgi:4-hydroxy-tetrahydrodipicolinate reductase